MVEGGCKRQGIHLDTRRMAAGIPVGSVLGVGNPLLVGKHWGGVAAADVLMGKATSQLHRHYQWMVVDGYQIPVCWWLKPYWSISWFSLPDVWRERETEGNGDNFGDEIKAQNT